MTEDMGTPGDRDRGHPQDPAEGPDDASADGSPGEDTGATNEPRTHSEDPAEGPDDSSATDS